MEPIYFSLISHKWVAWCVRCAACDSPPITSHIPSLTSLTAPLRQKQNGEYKYPPQEFYNKEGGITVQEVNNSLLILQKQKLVVQCISRIFRINNYIAG